MLVFQVCQKGVSTETIETYMYLDPLLGQCSSFYAMSYGFLSWASAHAGQNCELWLSAHGCLPGTLRYYYCHPHYQCTSPWTLQLKMMSLIHYWEASVIEAMWHRMTTFVHTICLHPLSSKDPCKFYFPENRHVVIMQCPILCWILRGLFSGPYSYSIPLW